MHILRTPEEIKEITDEVYKLKTQADITEEDIAWGKEKFTKPEDFVMLRKILRLLTNEDRGIFHTSMEEVMGTSDEDLKRFALDVKVNNMTQERIRQSLVSFYIMVKGSLEKDKAKEIDIEEKNKKIDNEKNAEMKKEHEESLKDFGDNI